MRDSPRSSNNGVDRRRRRRPRHVYPSDAEKTQASQGDPSPDLRIIEARRDDRHRRAGRDVLSDRVPPQAVRTNCELAPRAGISEPHPSSGPAPRPEPPTLDRTSVPTDMPTEFNLCAPNTRTERHQMSPAGRAISAHLERPAWAVEGGAR